MAVFRPSLLPILALAASQASAQAPAAALGAISEQGLLGHIRTLASDEFEGRSPGSAGEEKTVAYLEQQFRKLGLKPGNPDGTYVQQVPMRGLTPTPAFSYQIGGKTVPLRFPDDYVAHSTAPRTSVQVADSEIVFVGYGVVAPEYGWDDYKGMDVRGKTLLMLINDPAIPDPRDPAQLDKSMFKGAAMTYYGRWTYKYEIAARLGAAAAIIVHETKPAAYPYEVVKTGGTGENFSLLRDGPDPDAPTIPGWIHLDRAKDMIAAAGHDFDMLKQAALKKDFRPVSLKATAAFQVENVARTVRSRNVVAMIEGSDPKLKHEYVVYTAHWDHFGIDEKLPGPRGKQIYHGALDNASGTGALLELAKAYKALPKAPKRSIVFIATTAEERGLLGAKYYARNPLYPLERTLANINIDGVNAWGRTAQIENVTSGHSTLDELLEKYAKKQGRRMEPDSRPELGSFYRADQLEFARVGVPVLYTKARSNYIGKPAGYAREVVDHYVAHDYHKVSDDVRGDWDFSGGVQDIQLLFQVGYDVAQGKTWPQWKPASEFKRRP
ncbi:M28 family peptidase [Pseudoduganella namucuonensis]|uniref:Zn-dependent amino-or carboxypeptidase, M28 family n=1 Tax=Pseudoduganella namucuonensis TaxID=1035707 RepID=A0A1I7KEZ9_9BURK|nr:M28 family peptidase [Pseudoduganella namucuonensis]SFU96007.1 Zn-dependent amino-or carboxypeptidase, M28 family [Pseudoduganella namucuonensis]